MLNKVLLLVIYSWAADTVMDNHSILVGSALPVSFIKNGKGERKSTKRTFRRLDIHFEMKLFNWLFKFTFKEAD